MVGLLLDCHSIIVFLTTWMWSNAVYTLVDHTAYGARFVVDTIRHTPAAIPGIVLGF